MAPTPNPFVFGRVLAAGELVDRAAELATLERNLGREGRLFLIGPRRFGKTSLLAVAAERATAGGTPTLLVNAERYTTLDGLAGAVIAAASELLSPSLRERAADVARWFAGLKPQAEYDPMTDSFKVSVTAREEAPPAQTLATALDTLDRLAGARSKRLGVIVDEFQLVNELGGIGAERQLRAAVQTHRHLSYVFAGSHTRMLLAMISEHRRPFYRLGESLYLGPVPRAPFSTFLVEGLAPVASWTPEALTHVFEVCEDVPYSVQRLAHALFDDFEAGSDGDRVGAIEVADVERALDGLVATLHATFLATYLTLTTTQRRVLAGMAHLPDLNGEVAAASRRVGVAASTYRTARDRFLRADLLHERFGARRERRQYAFVDPFFRRWLTGFARG